jgi:8-oxo-dGTP diphosphatase
MEHSHPLVGIGVIIVRDGKVLMHKRKGAHGEGHWSFPGGHLEFGESPEECAKRETMEEAGMEIEDMEVVALTNDISSVTHYVTIYVKANKAFGLPKIMEPDKCERWDWFAWEELPEPLFLPVQNLLNSGFHPLN